MREFTQGLYDPLTRGNVYMRLSYDLTPSTEIFATLNYGISRTQNTPAQGNSDKQGTLHCDNAYLPGIGLFGNGLNATATQAACVALYNSAGTGTLAQQAAAANIQFASQWGNIPLDQEMFLLRTQRRYVVGGDGSFDLFGKSWNWDSYFEHGETDTSIKIYNMPLSGAPADPTTASLARSDHQQQPVALQPGAGRGV